MKGYISEENIEKVRESTDIVDLVGDYLQLKRTGVNYVGLCPFHNEKTPSFTVSESKQFFHCFGCGEGGDVVSFIMKKENLDFPDAVRLLADRAGIMLEESTPRDVELANERSRGYKINRDAARFFFSKLWESERQLNYLRNRGIGDRTIKQFGLGFAPDSWNSLYDHLKSKGYEDGAIEKVALIGKRSKGTGYYDKFRNRIIFPIINTKGNVIGFGGRVIDDTMPKYLNSQETYIFNKGYNLYGLNLLDKFSDKKRIILVEGYMDVIALFANGINYSVASLGTALTDRQAKLVKRYGKEVYIAYDADQAGIKATEKAVAILRNQDIEPKIINLDPFNDPDDFIRERGLAEFEDKIKNAYKYIDYKIYINKKKYNIDEIDDKIKFTIEIAKDIKTLKSPIEKDIYIDKISKEMNISKDAMEKEVFGRRTKQTPYRRYESTRRVQGEKTVLRSGDFMAEKELIKLIVYDREFYDIISEAISLEEFNNKECKELYRLAKGIYEKEESIDKEKMITAMETIEDIDMELVKNILNAKIKFLPENIDKIIVDLIEKKKINKLEARRNEINKRIKMLEIKQDKGSEEETEFLNLCAELINLNKKLNLNRAEDGR